MICKKGDIFMAVLNEDPDGNLQAGIRPVLIASNDKANMYSPVITVLPISSKVNKKKLPTHVDIQNCGLKCPSIILAEQITSINKSSLKRKMGSIQKTEYVEQVKQAIEIQLNL